MVSFFGLRFGADKKKQQQKQADRKSTILPEQQQQQQQQQQQENRTASAEDQLTDNDFCQPAPRRLSRPGTSTSTAGRSSTWRIPDVPAACSMIDLPTSSRRQPSVGSVCQLSVGEDPAAAAGAAKPIASPASLMLPSPYGNSVSLPGTPNKPQSARMKKWVDPLDMSISRSLSADDAGTTDMSVKSPLDKIRFDVQELGERGGMRIEQDRDLLDHDDGCPSPPRSIDGGNELRPTISVTSIGNRVPAPLPSPVPSVPVSGEDKWEIPRIRNVKAKRDTMTFQSPRRRSFIMEVEEANKEKQKMQQRQVQHTAQVVEISNHCLSAEEMRLSMCIDMMESPTEMAQPNAFKDDQAAQESSQPQERTQESLSQATPAAPAADARSEQPDPDAKLFEREAPKGFNSRARSDSRARSPRPSLHPLTISTNVQSATQSSEKPPISPLASKTPMEGHFPVSNGLPRGRLPTRPSLSVETSKKEDDDRSSVYSAASREDIDTSEPCKSAIPAPLFLSGLQQDPFPGATMAPLLSPMFSEVDRVLSKDTIELAKTFEISLDLPTTCDFGDFGDFMSKD